MAERTGQGVRSLLSARGFRRLLIGQGVSGLGDWVATLAFIALAFDLTHDQTAVAFVLVLRLVPPIFAAPIGGILADRLERRRVMVSCDLARAALIASVPFIGLGGLYAVAFVHECISLLFLPARDASVPRLAPEGTLPLANGFILASSYGSIPFAAALFSALRLVANVPSWMPFGHLIRSHPTSFAFFFDAATFVFSAALIARTEIPPGKAGPDLHVFSGLAEGFRYALGSPVLRSLGEGLVVSMFGGGVLFAIGIAYIHRTLGGNDVEFGWLAALWGAGMGLGLGAVRPLVRHRGAPYVFLAAVLLCGGVLIVMALLPLLWLAFVSAVIFGSAFSMAITVALSLAQRVTDERLMGRVMAGVQMLFRVGLGAGALGVGALAHAVGDVHIGVGGFSLTLDGNQIGLFTGGLLILVGALASAGVLQARETFDDTPQSAQPEPAVVSGVDARAEDQ